MMQNTADQIVSTKNIVRKSHPMWVNPQSANTSSPVMLVQAVTTVEDIMSDKDFYCSERATD